MGFDLPIATRIAQAHLKQSIVNVSSAWLVVYLAVIVHLALYWVPQINHEWVFSEAMHYFQTGDLESVNRFFSLQANTLGLSYLSYLISKLSHSAEAVFLPRIISSIGILFLGSALVRLCKTMDMGSSKLLLVVFVLVNPLVWVYSGRGTADFLPAALALFSISLFWDKTVGTTGIAIAIILLSLAITLKYHAAMFLPLLWMEYLSRSNVSIRSALLRITTITSLILVGPILYIFYIKYEFGFWFTPPTFQTTHQIGFSFFLTNVFSYLGYLSALLLPLSIFSIAKRCSSASSLNPSMAIFMSLFLLGYFTGEPTGEMRFGPFDKYLSDGIVYGFLYSCSGILIFVVSDNYLAYKNDSEKLRLLICIIIGIAASVLILSLTRPAQRYLLFLMPAAYFLVLTYKNGNRVAMALAFSLMVLINVYVGFSQYATGSAARQMAEEIQGRGLIEITSAGAIMGHVGNLFPHATSFAKHYVVVNGLQPGNLFYVESSPIPFIRKVFSLVPLTGS